MSNYEHPVDGHRGFPPSQARYRGRVGIVTGASRGIGLSVARRIVGEGGKVVITARSPEALDEAAASLGGPAVAVAVAGAADDKDHRLKATTAALDHFGRIDLLVNNAGINPVFGPLLDSDLEVSAKVLDVNVLATLGWVGETYRQWFARHGGAVVNVASAAGIRPAMGVGLYGVSKAAVIQLTRQLAVELAPSIRVNAIAPAVVKTRFARVLYEEREDKVAARYPAGRLGQPADVAAAVAFLGSTDASWVTGQTVVVDGGLLLTGGV